MEEEIGGSVFELQNFVPHILVCRWFEDTGVYDTLNCRCPENLLMKIIDPDKIWFERYFEAFNFMIWKHPTVTFANWFMKLTGNEKIIFVETETDRFDWTFRFNGRIRYDYYTVCDRGEFFNNLRQMGFVDNNGTEEKIIEIKSEN